ncbi:hypothetical protein [Erythrobacter dokdonensis]|uniref:Lipoprotein n=1 Tax=Erythrobacter dokdonensis DSW-74 TaxID=1300349 RepID=A0A1A7BGY2_9SPHN|nr:hypothetical protein [Erythrobacter dokdonensis]OBV10470.1 hypothetical protein I603_2432 [Erythrobacter dokdonensis DSW-74]
MKNIQRTLVLGCSLVALAGCGADEIVSPGTSGDINVNITNPAPTPTPTPTPTQSLVTPAAGCPTINSTGGLTDAGTITGPTGTWRVCTLPATVDASDTLPYVAGLLYQLGGQTFVGTDQGFASTGNNVTLTVEPGVIVFAQGSSALIVNRGNRLNANGTADRPIVWTSRDNVIGVANDNSQQQWGGVVLLGRARVSDCSTGVFNTDDTFSQNTTCQQNLEGAATTIPYGGANDADNSGSMRFNQIRFSGFELAPGNELQSLTTGGTGSGTVIENLQSFNSSDDGVEFFGGTVRVRNLAVIGASDDSIDADTGALADLDTVVVVQRTTTGDSIIELDSNNGANTPIAARPRTRLQVNNFTFVENSAGSNGAMVRARGGAALSLTNGVMNKLDGDGTFCFRIDEPETVAALIGIDSVVCDGGTTRQARGSSGVSNDQALTAVTSGTNVNLAFTITLTGVVINGTGESGVTPFAASGRSSFFAPDRTFIGAIENQAGLEAAFRNWTCNSATLNFGSATGACTTLPVYN